MKPPVTGVTSAAIEVTRDRDVPNQKQPVILLVEDEWGSRRFLNDALADLGKVICVASAEEAMVAAESVIDDLSLVITDVVMRGKSGIDLTIYIRHELGHDEIPIFIYTAHASTELEEMAFASGASDFLEKPISIMRLRMRARAHLNLFLAERSRRPSGSLSVETTTGQPDKDEHLVTKRLNIEVERACIGGYALGLFSVYPDFGAIPADELEGGKDGFIGDLLKLISQMFSKPYQFMCNDGSDRYFVITMGASIDEVSKQLWSLSSELEYFVGQHALYGVSIQLGGSILDASALFDEERSAIDVRTVALNQLDRSIALSEQADSMGAVGVAQAIITL